MLGGVRGRWIVAALGLAGCSWRGQSPPPDADLTDAPPDAPLPPFREPANVMVGGAVRLVDVRVADFNGDGHDDIVALSTSFNTLVVSLNTTPLDNAETALFATPVEIPLLGFPLRIDVADFNGDGRPDIAVGPSSSVGAAILLNTTPSMATTPTFADGVQFAAGADAVNIAAGDVDGDTKPDLVLGTFGEAPAEGRAGVLLNRTATALAFTPVVEFAVGRAARDVRVADFNGDGRGDIAAVNASADTVTVLRSTTPTNATAPTFSKVGAFLTDDEPHALAAADLDGDGKQDLAVTANHGSRVSVLVNTTAASGPVSFSENVVRSVGVGPDGIATGMLEGMPFVAAVTPINRSVSVLHGDGLTRLDHLPAVLIVGAIATGDFNRDGKHDLVLTSEKAFVIMLAR
jgi:hypothetical protein